MENFLELTVLFFGKKKHKYKKILNNFFFTNCEVGASKKYKKIEF